MNLRSSFASDRWFERSDRLSVVPCLVGLLLLLILSAATLFAQEIPSGDPLATLVRGQDDAVSAVLTEKAGTYRNLRDAGEEITLLAGAYTCPDSRHYHQPALIERMLSQAQVLRSAQLPSGLFNLGNLNSPPDSAFILKTVARGQWFLQRENAPETALLRAALKPLILSLADGVRKGGVHTPNHRWAICAALAQTHRLYPSDLYLQRIDDWLGEGLDIDVEGQWSERSPNYTSEVNNPSMVDLALLLDRPELLDSVRRSLEATLFQVEPNGEVETVLSRRQDQVPHAREYLWEYYVPFRLLAIRDQNARFAAVCRLIEHDHLQQVASHSLNLSSPISYFLAFPELRQPLPPGGDVETRYERYFPENGLARIRRENTSATIYGGSDAALQREAASGLATNPTFFKFRKGAAILDSVRVSAAFFNTGFFFGAGLEKIAEGHYRLREKRRVPYHLPLPQERRRADGLYPLTDDGRFFSRMDFPGRPKQYEELNTTVDVRAVAEAFELSIEVDGATAVPVMIELTFRKDGALAGVAAPSPRNDPFTRQAQPAADVFLLKEGFGSFRAGADWIEFGPGIAMHNLLRMDGERSSLLRNRESSDVYRVYLTGQTPFKHTLIVR